MKAIAIVIAIISLLFLASFLSSLDFSQTGFPGLIGESIFEMKTSNSVEEIALSTTDISLSGISNPACFPLFTVSGLDENHIHLRTHVSSEFSEGKWKVDNVQLNDPMSFSIGRIYGVKPLVKLSGYLPVAKDTISISIQAEYNSSAGIFYAENVSNPYYGIIIEKRQFPLEKGNYRKAKMDMNIFEFRKIRELALKITRNAKNDYEKAKMIEEYLKQNYEYSPNFNNTEISPYVFLFKERKGICTHFATAFIALATSIDLPARAVFGYLAKPTSSTQVVYSCQAHMWAEIKFGDYWVEFDPTPQSKPKIPTQTVITKWSNEIVEGENLSVSGLVKLENGEIVSYGYVEVYLKKNKSDAEGIFVGLARIKNGTFSLSTKINKSGKYNIVAHYTGSLLYGDSWSDPEVVVLSVPEIRTNLKEFIPENFTLKGEIIYKNESIPNKTVVIKIDDRIFTLTTDEKGEFILDLSLKKGEHKIEIVSTKENLFGEAKISKRVFAGELTILISNTTLIAEDDNRISLSIFFNNRPFEGRIKVNGMEKEIKNGKLALNVKPEKPGDITLQIEVGAFQKNLSLISKAKTRITAKEENGEIVFSIISDFGTTPSGIVEINGKSYVLRNGSVVVKKSSKEFKVRYFGDRYHLPSSLDYTPTNPFVYLIPLPIIGAIAGYYYINHPRIRLEFEKEHPELPDIWKTGETVKYKITSNYPCIVEVNGEIAEGFFSINSPGIYRVTIKALKNGKIKKRVEKIIEIVDDYGKGVEKVFRMFEEELKRKGIRTENLTAREIMKRFNGIGQKKDKLLRLFELYEYAGRGGYSRMDFVESFQIYLDLRREIK